jgi:hypothetical protein
MPMTCTVCGHPDRDGLEQAILTGASIRDIAGRTGLSRSAISRHLQSHLPAAATKEAASEDRQRAQTLHERLEALYVRAEAVVTEAERAGRGNVALAGIRELRGILEFAAKLAGVLDIAEAPPQVITLSFFDGSPLPDRTSRRLQGVEDPELPGGTA